jgi:hypothetical protein
MPQSWCQRTLGASEDLPAPYTAFRKLVWRGGVDYSLDPIDEESLP